MKFNLSTFNKYIGKDIKDVSDDITRIASKAYLDVNVLKYPMLTNIDTNDKRLNVVINTESEVERFFIG